MLKGHEKSKKLIRMLSGALLLAVLGSFDSQAAVLGIQAGMTAGRSEGMNVPQDEVSEHEQTVKQYGSIYEAYYQKYLELEEEYGVVQYYEDSSGYSGCSYLEGVCVVDLMDFNGDGTEDLFLVYANGTRTGMNMDDVPIPQAGGYEIEIWTCLDGELSQLLYVDHVGVFYPWQPNYWDEDDCFLTVYERADGLPVLQLYREGKESESYTNYYYENNAVTEEEFVFVYDQYTWTEEGDSYEEDAFLCDGEECSLEKWEEQVDGYDCILLNAYLSSNGNSNAGLEKGYGSSIMDTKEWTERIVGALSKSKPLCFPRAECAYISVYMKAIRAFHRETGNYTYYYPNYALYDLDGNGMPELILKGGSCEADFFFRIYTVISGELRECGRISGGHTSLYVGGPEGMITYWAHMGDYWIEKWLLNGTEMEYETLAMGTTQEDYLSLADLGCQEYDTYLGLSYADQMNALYRYASGLSDQYRSWYLWMREMSKAHSAME